MQIEVKVPPLSESITEATLVSWHKKVGDAVKRDENLIDIETDKVVMELPAPADGVIVKILKADGGLVAAGEVIAMIDSEGKAAAAAPVVATASAKAAPVAPPAVSAAASPSAAKIAAENNVNAGDIAGTGRGGRVTKEDVVNKVSGAPAAPALAAKPATPAPAIQLPAGDRTEQRVPMSRLRARIAERLVQSQSTAAILTTFNEVNMAPVIDLRNKYKEKFEKEHGVKLGFMSFFVKAAVHALKKYPIVNASIDGSEIVYHGYYDIGIAVGSERGLVVPILRDADQMSIAGVEKKIAEFGQKAKDGKLTIEDLSGGTFSISNAACSARCYPRRSSTRRNRRSSACMRPRSAR